MGQGDQNIDHDVHAGLGLTAVVESIKVAARHEGKRRSERWLGPAGGRWLWVFTVVIGLLKDIGIIRFVLS